MYGWNNGRNNEREDVFTAKLKWCADFARCGVHSNEDRVLSANSQPRATQ
jgi:hypothetical protein